jgi:hypothetical protein
VLPTNYMINDSNEIIEGLCRGKFPFGKYINIEIIEGLVIGQYHFDYDPKLIEMMLNSDMEMSRGVRSFIADVITGKIKRSKRSSTRQRDLELHAHIVKLMKQDVKLRSNAKTKGAACIAGENAKPFVDEGAAIKAYQRIQAEIKKAEQSVRELQSFLRGG